MILYCVLNYWPILLLMLIVIWICNCKRNKWKRYVRHWRKDRVQYRRGKIKKLGIFALVAGVICCALYDLRLFFFSEAILLPIAGLVLGNGFRWRVSSGLSIIGCVGLYVYFYRTQSMLILAYPFYCLTIFIVLLAIEWVTWLLKDKGYRGWWGVPLTSLMLLLVCICYPVVVRRTLVFLSPNAKIGIAFHVTDSKGRNVPHASVKVAFDTDISLGFSESTEKTGETDEGGIFVVKEKMHEVRYSVEKEGYYTTQSLLRANRKKRRQDELTKLKPGNQTLELVLKEKRDPIPMCARKNLLLEFPSDTEVGFDCMAGDLVAPYGEGKTAHFSFVCNMSRNGSDPAGRFLMATAPDGGFIRRSQDSFSQLHSMYEAPENGYSTLVLDFKYMGSLAGNPMEGNKSDYLIFKSQRNGGDSYYGKIYQLEYGIASYNSTNSGVRIGYHFNPILNDRNIEFDPKQNLSTKPASNDRNSMKMEKP